MGQGLWVPTQGLLIISITKIGPKSVDNPQELVSIIIDNQDVSTSKLARNTELHQSLLIFISQVNNN